MLDHPTDYLTAKTNHHLRHDITRFVEAGTELLADIEHLGTHLGCERATWHWSHDYDYLNDNPGLPTLTGHLHDRRPASARQAVQQWANVLGLTASHKPTRGTVSYDGEINGLKIRIWAVVDNKAFGGKLAALKHWAPDLILTGLLAASATASCVLLARHNRFTKALSR